MPPADDAGGLTRFGPGWRRTRAGPGPRRALADEEAPLTSNTATDIVTDRRPLTEIPAGLLALPVWPGDYDSGPWINAGLGPGG